MVKMNISELLITLHINTLYTLKLIASKNTLSLQQVLCIYSIPLDGITQTNLADSLSVKISTLSRNLDKLESQNIIIKKTVKDDKRFFKIFLTDHGLNLFSKILSDLKDYTENLYLTTESDDIQSIIDSLLALNWSILQDKTQRV
tara:strand:+ start:87 stop:521 length:435 start_codon:yes stop_codon:yes gene_type:complete